MSPHILCTPITKEWDDSWISDDCPSLMLCVPDQSSPPTNLTGFCSCEYDWLGLLDSSDGLSCKQSSLSYALMSVNATIVIICFLTLIKIIKTIIDGRQETRILRDGLGITALLTTLTTLFELLALIFTQAMFWATEDSFDVINVAFIVCQSLMAILLIATLSFFGISLLFSLRNALKISRSQRSTRLAVFGLVFIIVIFASVFIPLFLMQVLAYVSMYSALFALISWTIFERVTSAFQKQHQTRISMTATNNPEQDRLTMLQKLTRQLYYGLIGFGAASVAQATFFISGRIYNSTVLLR